MTKIFILMTLLAFFIAGFTAEARLYPSPNPGVMEIHPEQYERVFAISDVHGMFQNLQKLLISQHIASFDLTTGKATWLAGKSLLIIVGDSIDKGPDSIDVLRTWIDLNEQAPAQHGAVLHLLGNHEAEFLADPTNKKASTFLAELAFKHISIDQITSPQGYFGRFVRQMPLAARVGNWLFCHAGFYPPMRWEDFQAKASSLISNGVYDSPFLIGPDSVLEAKDWYKDPAQVAGLLSRLSAAHFYGVVYGHQPGSLGVHGDIAGVDQLRLIKIDSGMAPSENGAEGSQPGHMLLFSNAIELSGMGPPEAYSLSATTIRRLPTQ